MIRPEHLPIEDKEEKRSQEKILLSDEAWKQFVQMMSEDVGPTETALNEAKSFNQGYFDGSRYRW